MALTKAMFIVERLLAEHPWRDLEHPWRDPEPRSPGSDRAPCDEELPEVRVKWIRGIRRESWCCDVIYAYLYGPLRPDSRIWC